MKISKEVGIKKRCSKCSMANSHLYYCPIENRKFTFNFATCDIDCWAHIPDVEYYKNKFKIKKSIYNSI